MKKHFTAGTLLLILTCGAVFVCAQEKANLRGWREIKVKKLFTFSIPSDMVKLDYHGVDSYIEAYRNDEMGFNFEYGLFNSNPLSQVYQSRPDYKVQDIEIDGKKGKVVTFNDTDKRFGHGYVAALYFDDLRINGNRVRLSMWVRYKAAIKEDVAMRIFRSVKFLEHLRAPNNSMQPTARQLGSHQLS